MLALVQNVIDIMSGVQASDKHLTYHISKGLEKMLAKFKAKHSGAQLNPNISTISMAESQVLEQQPMTNTFETFGLDFPETWNEYPTSLDFFPVVFSGAQGR